MSDIIMSIWVIIMLLPAFLSQSTFVIFPLQVDETFSVSHFGSAGSQFG